MDDLDRSLAKLRRVAERAVAKALNERLSLERRRALGPSLPPLERAESTGLTKEAVLAPQVSARPSIFKRLLTSITPLFGRRFRR